MYLYGLPCMHKNTISYVFFFHSGKVGIQFQDFYGFFMVPDIAELFSSYEQLYMLLLNVFGTHWKYPSL